MDDVQQMDPGVSMFVSYRYTEDRIYRAIQDAGFDDWTLPRCRVSQRIVPEGSRLTDLADQAQVSKQSAGVLVEQLERLGYVHRVPDPPDGRARLIVLEERGRQAAAVACLQEAGKLPLSPTTSRGNVARFLLRAATEGSFVRETALVLDAK